MTRRLADLARIAQTDSTVTVTLIDAALHNLHESVGGYPATTPGASTATTGPVAECRHPDCTNDAPCALHDPDGNVTLTATERLAGQPDKAATDLEALTEHLRKAAHHLRHTATIASRWGLAGIDQTTVKERLITIDAEIWCRNCQANGHREVRLADRTECDFCSDFRREYGRSAPKDVLDIKATRRLYVQDIERILDRIDPRWRKKAKKGKVA